MKLCAATGVAILAALASGSFAPPARAAKLLVSDHGLTVRASSGSSCAEIDPAPGEPGGFVCADVLYPLVVKGHLPVKPRDRIALRFRDQRGVVDEVKRVHIGLVHTEGGGVLADFGFLDWRAKAHRVRNGKREKWRFRLPANLTAANVLDVFVRYEGLGDADFWAGLAPASP